MDAQAMEDDVKSMTQILKEEQDKSGETKLKS
jgi:hypothetical protein